MSAARNWWPQQCLLAWLNLVFTAPVIYLYVGLPLVLRQHGWSGLDIGLLQLAGLPAILKFLLAAPVDRWRLGRASYRNWGMLLGLAYAGALWLMGVHDLGRSSYAQLFTLAMLVSLLGTWVDVPVNALAIQMLPPAQRMRAGALRSAATSLGAIVGGGLALMLYDQGGWAWPFQALALAVLSGVLLAPWLGAGQAPQPEAPAAPAGGWRAYLRGWPGLARRPIGYGRSFWCCTTRRSVLCGSISNRSCWIRVLRRGASPGSSAFWAAWWPRWPAWRRPVCHADRRQLRHCPGSAALICWPSRPWLWLRSGNWGRRRSRLRPC
ncbi:MFS transporter [Bordetella trematum]|uniref:MFS transporter n=1 Tax=Bordetella trematum TaxID=123899 RepID=UPI000A430789|nr:MFS transporter [Bordetella trematum]